MQTPARGGPAGPRSARPPAHAGRPHALGPHRPSTPSGRAPTRGLCSQGLSPTPTRRLPQPPSATADTPPQPSAGREFMAIADAGSRGARDVLDMSDYDSDDGEPGISSAVLRSLKRLDVPYAVIQLADEVYARLVETDVSTPDGPTKLATALFAVIPPPGVGSGPLVPVADSEGSGSDAPRVVANLNMPGTGGAATFHDLEAIGERDLLAILRRLGRQGGAPVAIALHELLDAADVGYLTKTRAVYAVLMHVSMLNGDGAAVDEVWEKMVAAGIAPDDEAFNQAVSAHAKSRRLDRAATLYAAAQAAGARLDSVTFSTLLSALEKTVPYYDGFDPISLPPGSRPPWLTAAGAVAADHVRELWRDMGKSGVRPSTFTHRAIVASLARAGDLEGAEAAAAEQAASQPGGGGPPAVIGSHLILGAIWVGDWARASRALVSLVAADPATAAGGADPSRLVMDAIRSGSREGFAFALEAAKKLRPLYWGPGAAALLAARTTTTAEEKAAFAAGSSRGGGGGGPPPDKAASAANPSTSRPSLLRLLAAAHELASADDALEIGRWIVEEGWKPETRAVGLMARTLAKAGRPGDAAAYLRSVRAPSLDARFGPALRGLDTAAAATEEGSDEAAAEGVAAVLSGPLAAFAPPPGWHSSRGPAAQAVIPPSTVAAMSSRASSGPRRLAPRGSGGGARRLVQGGEAAAPASSQPKRPWG